MKSILKELSNRVREAMTQIGADGDPLLATARDPKFGDYQSNCAMGLAKKLGKKPRDVAAELVAAIKVDDICQPLEIAGPGFINMRLKPEYVAECLGAVSPEDATGEDRLGIPKAAEPQTVVIDLSSPNLAKEMHVGHLRSTVIGDCVARVLEFEGHKVHRENHVGDWGTQFGMLVAHLRRVRPEVMDSPDDLEISDLESFYVEAKARFDADDDFKTESRETVVALQSGDEATRRIWKAFCNESLRHCHAIYDMLGVELQDRGESAYADLMKDVIARLDTARDAGQADFIRESDGALCMFLDGFTAKDGEPLPLIVRKSDGGFNYATSDLATIIHRIESLGATRIIYVVGLAQKQHFEMVFAATRKAGWAGDHVSLEHLGFGNMLTAGGRPFKTREGGTVKLKALLDEAIARARTTVEAQFSQESDGRPALGEDEIDAIAKTVGLGAVKYFDLWHALNSDYKFDLNTMCSLEGNTAPYMLYAYARIRSIGRKAGIDFTTLATDAPLSLEHPAEIALATKLAHFPEVLDVVCRDLHPNVLTEYLYELSKTFSRFYDRKVGVRVIDASPDEVRMSRLRLCDLTARIIKLGLKLLGIGTVEQM